MDIGLREFDELTTLIYGAALDDSKWDVFLHRLAHLFGGVRTHMYGFDFDSNSDFGMKCALFDPEFIQSYQDYFFDKNAWTDSLFKGTIGAPRQAESMCSLERLYQTEWYNDWILPQEDILGGGGVMLFKEETRLFLLGGNIRRRDIDLIEKPWMEIVSLLTPHLQQAFEIARTVSDQVLERQALSATPDPCAAAVFAISEDRRMLYANRAVEHLLDDGAFIRLDFGRRQTFTQWSHDQTFERKLAGVAGSDLHLPETFKLRDCAQDTEWTVRIARVVPEALPYSGLCIPYGTDKAIFLVTLTSAKSIRDTEQLALGKHFGLTDFETRSILRLVEGLSPREIAQEREVSVYTVRNQIKSAMSKMGVRRQIDIGRLVEAQRH
ncbi:helix-turn-helix transcriptional regulator [Oricola sp.]|uniref:helix-turn-helix transcriptional regulator n=1 Tax=Oricola sp. TaxID=1979950 RepID=UPI0025FB4239|nr:helix-turn-helix transcriptional regulator [Oricola sp.]MCI5076865.1 helix-turn-helix transcriptional regulator [Oricola sp.]